MTRSPTSTADQPPAHRTEGAHQTPTPAELAAFIADCNRSRHGRDRFQHGTRRAALRMIRNTPRGTAMPRYEVRTIAADPDGALFRENPPEPVHYVHDTVRDRPVFGSWHDKTAADNHCASLNQDTQPGPCSHCYSTDGHHVQCPNF
ncbi:hypothetical protein ACWD25_04010 [Streptomyces sp. NPDC002920]